MARAPAHQPHALRRQLPGRGVRPDERRRGIEELPPEIYFDATYYERWLFGVTNILIEKGMLDEEEISRELARLDAGGIGDGAR